MRRVICKGSNDAMIGEVASAAQRDLGHSKTLQWHNNATSSPSHVSFAARNTAATGYMVRLGCFK